MEDESLFAVIWTELAIGDLRGICSFIAEDNPLAAERIGNAILEHAELLARFPYIGPGYPPSAGLMRSITFRRLYRIFYTVAPREKVVRVMRVWHGARDEPLLPTLDL